MYQNQWWLTLPCRVYHISFHLNGIADENCRNLMRQLWLEVSLASDTSVIGSSKFSAENAQLCWNDQKKQNQECCQCLHCKRYPYPLTLCWVTLYVSLSLPALQPVSIITRTINDDAESPPSSSRLKEENEDTYLCKPCPRLKKKELLKELQASLKFCTVTSVSKVLYDSLALCIVLEPR